MYSFGNQWIVRNGDPITLYFQILDVDQAVQGNNAIPFGGYGGFTGSVFSGITGVGTTAGLRYLVGVGTDNQPYGVQVTFPSIDSNQVVTIKATQADPNDSSIWKVSIPANQAIGGGNVQFAVTQGTSTYRFNVTNMLGVEFPGSVGSTC
jgi:hypothetical protein